MNKLEKEDKKTDGKIWKAFGPIIIILFAIIIADRMTGFLSPNPKASMCGTVITSDSSSDEFKGDKSHGRVGMSSGEKTYSVDDYVEKGDTVCQDGSKRIKKDDYLKKFIFIQ